MSNSTDAAKKPTTTTTEAKKQPTEGAKKSAPTMNIFQRMLAATSEINRVAKNLKVDISKSQSYNEIVLITMLGTLPIRIRRQFEAGRKVGNTHQKALIFLKSKGDTDALREYLDDFTETRILTPMKKSILVFLKGRAVKKKELETYEFDCT